MAKKDRLSIFETRKGYVFYIGWLCWEDDYGDEEGLRLGEGTGTEDLDDHRAAEQAVKDMKDGREESGAFFWESRSRAVKALKVAKEAIKNIEKPLPEWAKTAIAEGWKAPKGWKS